MINYVQPDMYLKRNSKGDQYSHVFPVQLVDYQLEVDKGKLTAVAKLFEKLTFRALALRRSILHRRRANARNVSFSNSLRRLIYLYQLQVDNQLVV